MPGSPGLPLALANRKISGISADSFPEATRTPAGLHARKHPRWPGHREARPCATQAGARTCRRSPSRARIRAWTATAARTHRRRSIPDRSRIPILWPGACPWARAGQRLRPAPSAGGTPAGSAALGRSHWRSLVSRSEGTMHAVGLCAAGPAIRWLTHPGQSKGRQVVTVPAETAPAGTGAFPAPEPSVTDTIAGELGVRPGQVAAAVGLLDGGATVPFIARYRK